MTASATRPHRSIFTLCLAVALVAVMSVPASAQLARMLGNSRLSPEDIEMATETATRLYTKPGVRVGDTAEWSNQNTGARGIVEITSVDEGGACVSFRHTTLAGANRQTQSASRRCRQPDNSWVFVPE